MDRNGNFAECTQRRSLWTPRIFKILQHHLDGPEDSRDPLWRRRDACDPDPSVVEGKRGEKGTEEIKKSFTKQQRLERLGPLVGVAWEKGERERDRKRERVREQQRVVWVNTEQRQQQAL